MRGVIYYYYYFLWRRRIYLLFYTQLHLGYIISSGVCVFRRFLNHLFMYEVNARGKKEKKNTRKFSREEYDGRRPRPGNIANHLRGSRGWSPGNVRIIDGRAPLYRLRMATNTYLDSGRYLAVRRLLLYSRVYVLNNFFQLRQTTWNTTFSIEKPQRARASTVSDDKSARNPISSCFSAGRFTRTFDSHLGFDHFFFCIRRALFTLLRKRKKKITHLRTSVLI